MTGPSFDADAVLEARARALAKKETEDAAPRAELVLVRRGGVLLGLGVHEVESSGRVKDLTPIPGAPAWLRGATFHRGHVVSLIDLLSVWGEGQGASDLPSFVCVRLGNRRVGLLVEELLGLDEADAQLEPWRSAERPGVVSVTQRRGERVFLISAERLFSIAELEG